VPDDLRAQHADQSFTGGAWPDHPSWMRAFMEHLRKGAPVE
jgi:hypothetical protein